MPAMWGGIAAGAGSLLGGLIGDASSAAGVASTNATNLEIAKMNNMEMENLANTSMQRRVLDLKAAGLNPMLAVGGPGAAVPQLQQATMQNPNAAYAQLGQQVSGAVGTGMGVYTGAAQASAAQGQALASAADANLKNVQAGKIGGVDTAEVTQNIAESKTRQDLMVAQTDAASAQAGLSNAQVQVAQAQLPKIQAEIANLTASKNATEAQAALTRLQADMQGLSNAQFKLISPDLVKSAHYAASSAGTDSYVKYLDVQRARNQAAMQSGEFGATLPYIDAIFNWLHIGANIVK